jgi:hypothetical protein
MKMIKKRFCHKVTIVLVMVLGFSMTNSVFAADRYRVSTQVFHLGEMIAQPVIDVVEGETTGGTYSVPGGSRYTFVVLVRPIADDKVSVSLQFSSGKIDIQPNLVVDIGQETSATIDKIRLNLLVQSIVETDLPTLIANNI